jgi:hypothetical protein
MIAPLLLIAALATAPQNGPDFRVETDARRRTIVLDVGPVHLPSGSDYDAITPPITVSGVWGVDGWLRSFSVEVVNEAGEVLPNSSLHHLALIAPEQRELFRPIARRITAFGRETESIRLPGQLGYRVEPTDSFRVVASLFNPGDEPLHAHVRMKLEYADAWLDAVHSEVLPFYLDAGGEGPSGFDVPPGGARQSWEWSPAVSGRIIGLGGHLHEHAVALILEDVTEGKVMWTGEPIYGPEGELRGVSRKFFLRGKKLHADHRYRVTAVYENATGDVIRGAMGHVGGLFLPDRGGSIPPADRADPAYLADEYGSAQATHAHHHP